MQVIKGKQKTALRAIVYGPAGIGKTTLASRWPQPLFLDVEGGTAEMEVDRLAKPLSWSAFRQVLTELATGAMGYKTLVVDTIDWAEKLCREQVCAEAGVNALGDKEYGVLYARVQVEWLKMLDQLSVIADGGTNIVLLAHSTLVHCDIPEENGTFDKWEMKLLNSFKVNLSAACKEWASLVLFCSYATIVVEHEGKAKASGGKRVCYSTHHPCWDAKQRTGMNLPEKMDLPADKLPDPLALLLGFAVAPAAKAATPGKAAVKPVAQVKPAATATAGVSPAATPAAQVAPPQTAAEATAIALEKARALVARNAAANAAKATTEPATCQQSPAELGVTKPADTPAPESLGAALTTVPTAVGLIDPEKAPLLAQLTQLREGAGISLEELCAELVKKGVCTEGMNPADYNLPTLQRVVSKWAAVAHNIVKNRAAVAAVG